MKKIIFMLCIVMSVFAGAAEQNATCPAPSIKAIRDDAQYAVKFFYWLYISPKFTDDILTKDFPKVQKEHWIKANDGNSFFHFRFNTSVKNFRVFVAKNGGTGIKDWTNETSPKPAQTIEKLDDSLLTLHGLLISPNPIINEAQVLENGKLIFHKERLQKGSEILIQSLYTESINAVVYFELKNGVKIQHIIAGSGGNTFFYDFCGRFYNYDDGMEDDEDWSVFTEGIGWVSIE